MPSDIILQARDVHRHFGGLRAVDGMDLDVERPGVYRVEARIDGRLWLLSNQIQLR